MCISRFLSVIELPFLPTPSFLPIFFSTSNRLSSFCYFTHFSFSVAPALSDFLFVVLVRYVFFLSSRLRPVVVKNFTYNIERNPIRGKHERIFVLTLYLFFLLFPYLYPKWMVAINVEIFASLCIIAKNFIARSKKKVMGNELVMKYFLLFFFEIFRWMYKYNEVMKKTWKCMPAILNLVKRWWWRISDSWSTFFDHSSMTLHSELADIVQHIGPVAG